MRRRRWWAGSILGASLLASPTAAEAALTQSEQAQIRQFVGGGQLPNAARVRSLVARPDLSAEESAAALRDALAPVVFDDAKVLFFRDMLFGASSAPSRAVVVAATVRGLVARADALLVKHQADLEGEPRALAELARIYGFIDSEIANAGSPRGWAHDPQAGIPTSTYDECAKALGEHVERNQKVLKADSAAPAPVVRVRAQAQIALSEMIGDLPTRRVDVADKLGLLGPRRAFMTDLGILVVDAGRADAARVEHVRSFVDRLPLVRTDMEALVFGDTGVGLRSRSKIAAFRTPLEGVPYAGPALFGDEVDAGPLDGAMVELARELSLVAARRALDKRPDLRLQAERDFKAAGSDPNRLLGRPLEPSVDAVVAAAMHLLVTDAPRTMDLALVRLLGGRTDSASLLSDALGALAAMAPSGAGGQGGGLSIALGRPKGADGATETVTATNVQLAPSGAVVGFTLQGHTWSFTRSDTGEVVSARRDGAALTLAALPTAKMPMSDGPTWNAGTASFTRLAGGPRAGAAPGLRARVVGMGARGWDAISTPAPGANVIVEATLAARGGDCALVLRSGSDARGLTGAMLVFSLAPDGDASKTRVALVSVLDGQEAFLTAPQTIPASGTYAVKMTLKGTKLEVDVAGTALKGTLPPQLTSGGVGLGAKRGATLEVSGLAVRAAPGR